MVDSIVENERATNHNLPAWFQSYRIHDATRPSPWIESGVERAVAVHSRNIVPCYTIVAREIAPDHELPVRLQCHGLN
jgi:hypothetical protein